ncbi:hypothetical protein Bca101_080724 [Brassica carinata]
MVWEKEKIVGSCIIGGATFAVGASFLHLFLKGELPLGLGLGTRLFSFRKRRPVRVYMDGCFDMMHYGHCNALRQARALGDQLVVGVVSDEEIIANKGPPVTPLHERMVMVKAVKWVDEVISDAPYAITEDFMKRLFDEYQIDYIIHGDDPCVLPDGTDAYALAKKAGRYKQIKRTEGVSSTDIVGRMLLCVRERSNSHSHSSLQRQFSHGHNSPKFEDGGSSAGTRVSHFLPTSRRIVQFSNGKGPGPDARIIYIDGAFDLFHAGHVEILRRARELGDFLLVGIHNDQTVRFKKAQLWHAYFTLMSSARSGARHPIMNLHERSLSVLACRYVDEVIIGAPSEVSKDTVSSSALHFIIIYPNGFHEELILTMICIMQITTFDISLVVHGTVAESDDFQKKRNLKKEASEKKYYEQKSFVTGD